MQRFVLFIAVLLLAFSVLFAQAPARSSGSGQAHSTPSQKAQPTQTIGVPSHIRPTPENYRFPNSQVLHYSAEWRLWNAGIATVRMDANGSEQKITATAESTGFVSVLYRVADRFESYFDRKTFCSTHIFKHSEEGLHKRETNIRFDPVRKKAILDERNLRNNETKHTEQDIPPCVTDVISGIFYVASLPLEPGMTYTFPLNDGGKTVDVRAHVEAREDIKTDAGTFKTIRVQPEAETGVLKSRGKIWIWYTDDAAHIPVQMRARLFWGTLTFQLARIERAQ